MNTVKLFPETKVTENICYDRFELVSDIELVRGCKFRVKFNSPQFYIKNGEEHFYGWAKRDLYIDESHPAYPFCAYPEELPLKREEETWVVNTYCLSEWGYQKAQPIPTWEWTEKKHLQFRGQNRVKQIIIEKCSRSIIVGEKVYPDLKGFLLDLKEEFSFRISWVYHILFKGCEKLPSLAIDSYLDKKSSSGKGSIDLVVSLLEKEKSIILDPRVK